MSTKKKIIGAAGIMLIIVIIVITGLTIHQSSSSTTNSDRATASSQSARYSASRSTSAASMKKSNEESSSLVAASSSSGTIDVKNLTNAQAVAWMKANMGAVLSQNYNTSDNAASNNGVTFDADDFDYIYNGHSGGWSGDSDDGVYYEVREDHSTANMKAAGADPETSNLACWFRITGDGVLQVQTSADDSGNFTWQTVSTSYDG